MVTSLEINTGQPLGSPPTRIRLLELLPRRDKIQCRMITVVLDSAEGVYEPTSYPWHKHKKTKDESIRITADGAGLFIETLYDALRQMQLDDK